MEIDMANPTGDAITVTRDAHKYNSMCTIGFTVYHNEKDGSDLSDKSLLRDLLLRIADVSASDGMLEAAGGDVSDTQLNED